MEEILADHRARVLAQSPVREITDPAEVARIVAELSAPRPTPKPLTLPSPAKGARPALAIRVARAHADAPLDLPPPPAPKAAPPPQAPPPAEPERPKRLPRAELRNGAERAAKTLKAIMAARGIQRTVLGEAMAQATGAPASTGHAALARLLDQRALLTRYWRVAAHAVGVALDDLCDDPTWLAAVEPTAPLAPCAPFRAPLPTSLPSPLRPAADRAAAALRALLEQRGENPTALLARVMHLAPPGREFDGLRASLSICAYGERPLIVSVTWPLAAAALGVPLGDLCDDPAWLAAQPALTAPPAPPASPAPAAPTPTPTLTPTQARYLSGPLLSDSLDDDLIDDARALDGDLEDEDDELNPDADLNPDVADDADSDVVEEDAPAAPPAEAPAPDHRAAPQGWQGDVHTMGRWVVEEVPSRDGGDAEALALGRTLQQILRAREGEANAARDAAIAEAMERAARAEAAAEEARRDLDAMRRDLVRAVTVMERLKGALLDVA